MANLTVPIFIHTPIPSISHYITPIHSVGTQKKKKGKRFTPIEFLERERYGNGDEASSGAYFGNGSSFQ